MTQVHFTMTTEDIQSLIQQSVENDVSKKILTMVFNQLMEQERSDYINASDYERSEERVSYRNGYYERDFTTRVGTLELRVPRTRDGKFSPSVFERYQRNEKALLAAMLEMYISGVSTRKVTKIVEELCGKKISKSFVSTLTKDLDEIVAKWQHSSLNNECYPYLMVDVIYLKVREEERVISKSCHIAIGFSQEGGRKVLGFLIQNGESEESWSHFFEYLKARNLQGVQMITSDAHKGLVASIKKSFTNVSWQRCQVHFLRNIFASIPKKDSVAFREQIKALFKFTDIDIARKTKAKITETYIDDRKYKTACTILDEGFEDAFQYITSGGRNSRLRSTNLLERLNEELRRRERIIRIFPNVSSANRLIGALLIDQSEQWEYAARNYIKM